MAKLPVGLVVACSLVALMGFGCAKKAPGVSATSTKPGTPSGNPAVIMFPPAGKPVTSVNDELRTVFSNFHDLKSFRSTFSMSSPQGSVTGTFSFLRPDRFKGTMHLQNGSSDLIVVGNSFYLHPDNSPWIDYSNTPAATTLTQMFRQAMDQGTTAENYGINDNTIITKSFDSARSCDDYKTTAKTNAGMVVSLDVCAVNQLPKFVNIQGPQGPSSIQYDQYNALFTIEKPI